MAFTPQQIEILSKSSNDFTFFVNNVFCHSVKKFIKGEYVDDTTRLLSQNKRTIRISARHHFKSFSFYAYFMWKLMFEGATSSIESHYFSFNADLAGYHISKIKRCIQDNPYFEDIIDAKPIAESVLRYTWDRKNYTTLSPHGLIQFKRGIHGDLIFVDDPFQDPENTLNPVVIYKINEIFKSNILDMPKEPDGELHVAGTPQTDQDFFFDPNLTKRFAVKTLPAIYTDKDGIERALWPEWMDLDELYRKQEERTPRIFSREYLCTPAYSTKGFFDREKIVTKVVNKDISQWKARLAYNPTNMVVAGFDIGKKTHPSHLSVFEVVNGKLRMVHQKWMDGWSYSNGKQFNEAYPTQLEYLKMCIKNFKIKHLTYDNTRGEFEAFAEQDLLPVEMEPIVFSSSMKNTLATNFDRLVERNQIEIIDEKRLIDQICVVTDDLQTIQSTQGHGDAFWSICMAILGVKGVIDFVSDEVPITRREVSSGIKSIFSEGEPIPKGW
jgi:hypothetical protein